VGNTFVNAIADNLLQLGLDFPMGCVIDNFSR